MGYPSAAAVELSICGGPSDALILAPTHRHPPPRPRTRTGVVDRVGARGGGVQAAAVVLPRRVDGVVDSDRRKQQGLRRQGAGQQGAQLGVSWERGVGSRVQRPRMLHTSDSKTASRPAATAAPWHQKQAVQKVRTRDSGLGLLSGRGSCTTRGPTFLSASSLLAGLTVMAPLRSLRAFPGQWQHM